MKRTSTWRGRSMLNFHNGQGYKPKLLKNFIRLIGKFFKRTGAARTGLKGVSYHLVGSKKLSFPFRMDQLLYKVTDPL
jgi:hypothetical protein